MVARVLTGNISGETTTSTGNIFVEAMRHRMLFGSTTQTTRNVRGADAQVRDPSNPSDHPTQNKAPGHGRNPAAVYTRAQRVPVPHPQLRATQSCPGRTSGNCILK